MTGENLKGILNPGSIRDIATSFQHSRILLTAFELDIFTSLEGRLYTSADLAAKLNLNDKALSRLLNALVTLGFISKTHNKFFNTEESSRYLVRGKPEYMAGLMHTNHLWDTWSNLTESVRKGTPAGKKEKGTNNWLDAFISAMHYRALPQAKIVSFLIDFLNVNSMLDLGGGSGAFAITFAKNNNAVKATVFDLPDVIELTKKYVEAENLQNRFNYIKGDYLADDYGAGYDLIFAAAIVHINSYDENKNLVNKCYKSLNNSGSLVIFDYVMNEEKTEPKQGAVFALNMLVGTKSGDTYTENEMRCWFNEAGFKSVERKDTSFGTSLMIAKKTE